MKSIQFKIFQEPPEDLDETWRRGALLGGMTAGAYDCLAIADAFKMAGDSLVDCVPTNVEGHEIVHPILYCYRHSVELYLKTIVRQQKKKHNLQDLLQQLIEYTKRHYQTEPPTLFTSLIMELDEYDRNSVAFRYPEPGIVSAKTNDEGEFWIRFTELKEGMNYLQVCFRRLAKDLH